MARTFPRNVADVVRALTQLCKDEKQPPALRARCGELVLASYGIVVLSPEQKPRQKGLKGLVHAQLDLARIDKQIVQHSRQKNRDKRARFTKELEKL